MSRVEEALRRASRTEDAGQDAPDVQGGRVAKIELQATAAPAGAAIADYPAESLLTDVRHQGPVRESAAKVAMAPAVRRRRDGAAASRRPVPPSSVAARALRKLSETVQGKVVVDDETSAVSIEEYRRLAAALHGMQVERGIKTIMISSALPRDGKTLTTTNLALTLSESYKRRVLVVDADLRRPSIHEIFSLPNDRGLAEGLRESSASNLPVLEVSPTLAVLTAGIPDRAPMAGLTSERMKEVLAEASARFDWVLIDTPPIGLISDAQLLASLVDGVVLVVGAGSTDYKAIAHTLSQVGRECILGIVLNRVEQPSSARGYYHDYYRANELTGSGMTS
jgi:capsular exopolysaccharide synthesis family protein